MPILVYNRKVEINEGGFLMRNWTTIKEYDEILFEHAGKVAKITINRPHVHNAF
ncbi:1,4-dihydroxy-2-naphthoyl-CoA synthase, partial [Enterococcus faecalis]